MAPVEIIDLDALATTVDRQVRLGGVVYRIPGEPPVGWLVDFRALAAATADAGDGDELAVIEQLRDTIADLFRFRQPDLDLDPVLTALDERGIGALISTVAQMYRGQGLDTGSAEGKASARPRRAAGTTNTSRRAKPATRSRSSS